MSERHFILNSIGIDSFPDKITFFIMLDLPPLCRANLDGIICLLILCSLNIEPGLADIMEQGHDYYRFITLRFNDTAPRGI